MKYDNDGPKSLRHKYTVNLHYGYKSKGKRALDVHY